ncbi:hypothetical protein [Bradyrhizobium sp. 157]|nr:hypothetical protein [Bradyrhizobium sp. 157]
MTDTVDLSAYFARIGYAGGGAPTLDTLPPCISDMPRPSLSRT